MTLLETDDAEHVLADVVAFIDAFHESESGSSNASPVRSSGDDHAQLEPSETGRKQRKAAASRRCQRKKRSELLTLRAVVLQLEHEAAQLRAERRRRPQPGAIGTGEQSAWCQAAHREMQRRNDAEKRNRMLKIVLARQSRATRSARRLAADLAAIGGIGDVVQALPSPVSTLDGFVPNQEDAIFGDLATKMEQLYLDADTVFADADTGTMDGTLQFKVDPSSGVRFAELRTSTVMELDMLEAARRLWSGTSCHYEQLRKYFTELGLQKQSTMELRDQDRVMPMHVRSLLRTYEEQERVLGTWASMAFEHPADTELRFCERGWFLLSRATDATSRCVLQSCYQLYPDNSAVSRTCRTRSAGTEARSTFVLEALGACVRSNILASHRGVMAPADASPIAVV